MEVTRKVTLEAFDACWCPACGKAVVMERLPTGLPGILAQKCVECSTFYQANYPDILTVPDNFVMVGWIGANGNEQNRS